MKKLALFFPDYVNNTYLSQKVKSNTEKYKGKRYLMSYDPGMQLNVDMGKEKENGLSLGTAFLQEGAGS